MSGDHAFLAVPLRRGQDGYGFSNLRIPSSIAAGPAGTV
jgi:hypothetical protein